MRPKTFDCVAMKRRAAKRIYEETKDMTFEQLVAYWQQRNEEFRQFQERVKAAAVLRPTSPPGRTQP